MRGQFLDMPLFYDWYGTCTNRMRKITYTARRGINVFGAVNARATLNQEELFGVPRGCLMLTNVIWERGAGTRLEFVESVIPRSMIIVWTEWTAVDGHDEGWSFWEPTRDVPYRMVDHQNVLELAT